MRIRTALLILAAALACNSTATVADTRKDKEECRKIKLEIRKIEARMRRPYTAAQGIRYDERLRDLKDRRYRRCR